MARNVILNIIISNLAVKNVKKVLYLNIIIKKYIVKNVVVYHIVNIENKDNVVKNVVDQTYTCEHSLQKMNVTQMEASAPTDTSNVETDIEFVSRT